jgi:hypothetical protein
MSSLYTNAPRLVLGFHGCERDVAQNALQLRAPLKHSQNDYDWLGHGIYFWENDPLRALEFAKENHKQNPSVIGAVIDLGNCLNLMERNAVKLLQQSYISLLADSVLQHYALPENMVEKHGHKLVRKLDCAVFENLHAAAKTVDEKYDTVVGTFMEGKPIYPDTEICEQTHIQICVRNPDCIKGYFLPINFKY